MPTKSTQKLILFFVALFLSSSPFYFAIWKMEGPYPRFHFLSRYFLPLLGLHACPALAAVLTEFLYESNIKELHFKESPSWIVLLLSFMLPAVGLGVGYGVVWALGLGSFPNQLFINTLPQRIEWSIGLIVSDPSMAIALYAIFHSLTSFIVFNYIAVLCADIGLIGFLYFKQFMISVFRMKEQKRSFGYMSVYIGIARTLWKLPIILPTSPNPGIACAGYLITTFSVSGIAIWLFLYSKSIFPGMFLHVGMLIFNQQLLYKLTAQAESSIYIDETGIIIGAVFIIIFSFFYLQREKALKK